MYFLIKSFHNNINIGQKKNWHVAPKLRRTVKLTTQFSGSEMDPYVKVVINIFCIHVFHTV